MTKKKPKPPLTDAQKNRVRKMLEFGIPQRRIAKIMDCNTRTVWRLFHEAEPPREVTREEIMAACWKIRQGWSDATLKARFRPYMSPLMGDDG